MSPDEIQRRLRADPDFINLPRYECSIVKLMERYPDGVPDRLIAAALGLSEDETKALHAQVVRKLQKAMGVK